MRKIVLWASAACAISVSHALFSAPVSAQIIVYQIEPQPLEAALFEFAEEARLSINFSGLQLEGVMSEGTRAHTSKSASLRSILRGTGIGFRFNDDSSVQLFKVQPRQEREKQTQAKRTFFPEEDVIEDLVVTANKRASTTFRLPANVSAVSNIALEDWSANDFQSVAPHLAGVLTTNLGPGQNKIFVRGMSDGVFTDRTQAIVGVYIDEAPVNYSDTNPDLRLFDVERIELLRGPQGTLYGSGSLAGVYRVITTKPDLDETSLRARLSLSNTNGGGPNGALDFAYNQPLVDDKLGLRFTGYIDFKSGYIDNVFMNLHDVNKLEMYGARPALRWKINDSWTLDFVGNFQAIQYDDSQYYFTDMGRNNRDNEIQEPYEDIFFHGNLTLRGEFSNYKLTSSTAYVDRTIEKVTDASDGLPLLDDISQVNSDIFSRSDVIEFSSTPEFLQIFQSDIVAYLNRNDIKIFSHETRLQSELEDGFEWLGGLFYQGRKQKMGSVLAFTLQNDPARAIRYALGENRFESSDELAVFGEATYYLTDKFSLTAGARYARAWLTLDHISVLALNDDAIAAIGTKTKESFIPKFAMRYEWSEDIQTYALASLGYRVGGININTPIAALVAADEDNPFQNGDIADFQSDNLFNSEIGLKSYWFDRRLGINLSAFLVKWFDLQSDQIGPSGLPLTLNVGEARIMGYELEFTARPVPGLELMGSFFWNDSEIVRDNPFLGIKAGDRLPAIPDNTASLSMVYEFVQGLEWTVALQADYSYVAESSLNFDEATSATMGGYGIVNAKLQFMKDKWKFGFFARNLTDSSANTFSYGNGFRLAEKTQITPPRPLTAGFFLETTF